MATRATPAGLVQAWRKIARKHSEVEEGVSCAKAAFKVRGKAFLFIGNDEDFCNAMVKLGESLPEAGELAAAHPDTYRVGAHGWVTVQFSAGQSPPTGLMERWIAESYQMFAPKAPKNRRGK